MVLYVLGALASGILGAIQGVMVGRASKGGGLFLATMSLSLTQALIPALMVALQGKEAAPAGWRLPLLMGALAGLIGTGTLTLNGLVINQIGAGTMFVLITTGLVAASLVLDHLGLSGVQKSALDPVKLAGTAMVLCGAWLISRR